MGGQSRRSCKTNIPRRFRKVISCLTPAKIPSWRIMSSQRSCHNNQSEDQSKITTLESVPSVQL